MALNKKKINVIYRKNTIKSCIQINMDSGRNIQQFLP